MKNKLMLFRVLSMCARLALAIMILSLIASPPVPGQDPPASQQEQQQQTFKIGTNLVIVPVIVTDRYGRFVTGLGRDDFFLREEGRQQKIEDFSSTEEPFNVALLIDTSRSTQNKLDKIRKAALAFIKQLLPNDRVMVVSFDERVRFVNGFTNNQAELERAIKSLKSSYLTSLYDAIHQTINERMDAVQGRKAIVVLTDGVDTASRQATFESTIDLVASAGIICYAIQYETRNDGGPIMKPLFLPGISNFAPGSSGARWQDQQPKKNNLEPEPKGESKPLINIPRPTLSDLEMNPSSSSSNPGSSPSTRVNRQAAQPIRDRYLIATDFLRTLTQLSGALHLRAENIENTNYQFQVIANELHNQYTLTYISTNERRDGHYRSIAVGVRHPDLVVRSRRRYRAPKEELPEPGKE